jgi:hypothetical protein
MSDTPTIDDPTTWALDREIVLVSVLTATRAAVFAAWTGADAFCHEQSDGNTVLTLRQLHPSAEHRTAAIGFGAVELGLQTMQKLARHLDAD